MTPEELAAARRDAEAALAAADARLKEQLELKAKGVEPFRVGDRVECRDGGQGPWTLGTVVADHPLQVRADGWLQAYQWEELRRPEFVPPPTHSEAASSSPASPESDAFHIERAQKQLERQRMAQQRQRKRSDSGTRDKRRPSLAAQFAADLASAGCAMSGAHVGIESQVLQRGAVDTPVKLLRLRLARGSVLRAATAGQQDKSEAEECEWMDAWAGSETCPLQLGSTGDDSYQPLAAVRNPVVEVAVVRGDAEQDICQRVLTCFAVPTSAGLVPRLTNEAGDDIRELSWAGVRDGTYTVTLDRADSGAHLQSPSTGPSAPSPRMSRSATPGGLRHRQSLERSASPNLRHPAEYSAALSKVLAPTGASSIGDKLPYVEDWIRNTASAVPSGPPGGVDRLLPDRGPKEFLVLRLDELGKVEEDFCVERGKDAIAALRQRRREVAVAYVGNLSAEEALMPPRCQRVPVRCGDGHDDAIDRLRSVYAEARDPFPPVGAIRVLNCNMEEVQCSYDAIAGGERLYSFSELPPPGHVQAAAVLAELQAYRAARAGHLTVEEPLPQRGAEADAKPIQICFYPRLAEMEAPPESTLTQVGQPLFEPYAAAADTEGAYGRPDFTAKGRRPRRDTEASEATQHSVPMQDADDEAGMARCVVIRDDRYPELYSHGDVHPGFSKRMQTHESAVQLAASVSLCACLVHGVTAEHFLLACRGGKLISAYTRLGPRPPPKGGYARKSDVRGGGATAVYTRSVGVAHEDWEAGGHGVGSGEAKIQVVLCADVLRDPEHTWRASTTDNMGKLPGVGMQELDRGGKDLFRLWAAQSEEDRNIAFYRTVKGRRATENNEQTHWEELPLEPLLCCVVGTARALEPIFESFRGRQGAAAAAGPASPAPPASATSAGTEPVGSPLPPQPPAVVAAAGSPRPAPAAERGWQPNGYVRPLQRCGSTKSVASKASEEAGAASPRGRGRTPQQSPGSPAPPRVFYFPLCGRLVPLVVCKEGQKMLAVLRAAGLIGKDGRVLRARPVEPGVTSPRHDHSSSLVAAAAASEVAPLPPPPAAAADH